MTRGLATAGAVWAIAFATLTGQGRRPIDPATIDQHPAIDYRGAPTTTDVVTALQRDLGSGATTLAFEGRLGFLRALLARLDVPVESQVLLFSKTGIQHPFTDPEHPRALYFNDRVVVGYIPGAPLIELASHDPRQGVIFQTLKQDAATPEIARPDRCLTCHLSANSLEVPGILVRSMFTDTTGRTRPQLGSTLVDHRTPLSQRWGGWYVTGSHGSARHLGNAMVTDNMAPEAAVNETTLNRTTLSPRVAAEAYPVATSDITALLVFDHQGRAINLLTRLGWEARIAAAESRFDLSQGDLRELVNETADYLLFVDEVPLAAPIQGVAGFAKIFADRGPRDRRGRSLRELDLRTRLFRYRCSYLIYSPAFDALPAPVREAVYARMEQILANRDDREVMEILDDTRRGWRLVRP